MPETGSNSPWLQGEAVRQIGPPVTVYEPHAQVMISLKGRFAAALVVPLFGAILIFGSRYESGYRLPERFGGDLVYPYLTFALLLLLCGLFLRYLWLPWWREAQRRLLVSQHGFAEWTPQGEQVFLWSEIGTTWHLNAPAGATFRYIPAILALENSRGERWYLSGMYEGIGQFVDHLAGQELQREMDHPSESQAMGSPMVQTIDSPVIRPIEPRHESLNPGSDSPWLHCEEIWKIEPLERACFLTKNSEFRLGVKWIGTYLTVFILGWVIFAPIIIWYNPFPLDGKPAPMENRVWGGLLILAIGAYIMGTGYYFNFVWRTPRTTHVRLVVGAGGILIWSVEGRYVVAWKDLDSQARIIAQAPQLQQESLLIKALFDCTRPNGGNFDPSARFTNGDWFVNRYLEEMRLRGVID